MLRNECSSCLVEGACILLFVSTFLGSGFTPCGVYISPKKLGNLDFTIHLSKFSLIPAF